MKNYLTVKIESWLGMVIIFLVSVFLLNIFLVAVKNFDSDIIIINSTSEPILVKNISETEKQLIRDWIKDNKIELPEDFSFKYFINKYPSRPWLE
jgi:hypothetical protein